VLPLKTPALLTERKGPDVNRKPKKRKKLNPEERRENALRPCPALGYDRDALAVHLLERGAYALAEGQFRRAVWLNPFEPAFKVHLAWCLCRQGRFEEARAWAMQAQEQEDGPQVREVLDLVERETMARSKCSRKDVRHE
jgi:Tfp pilus assembly protein PilF